MVLWQIFHLMKYDCWPRFLKSQEYAKCWQMAQRNERLAETEEPFLKALGVYRAASCKSLADPLQDKHKRRSILPWKGTIDD